MGVTMGEQHLVTSVIFRPALLLEQRDGLLGWASVQIDGWIRIHGFSIRRTRAGDLRAFPPERLDSWQRWRRIVEMAGEHTEQDIERQILDALAAQGALT
jgi:hypothetical protein